MLSGTGTPTRKTMRRSHRFEGFDREGAPVFSSYTKPSHGERRRAARNRNRRARASRKANR